MKPYTPDTNKGRTVAGDDIHHRTADQARKAADASAKAAKHAARQEGKRQSADGVSASAQETFSPETPSG